MLTFLAICIPLALLNVAIILSGAWLLYTIFRFMPWIVACAVAIAAIEAVGSYAQIVVIGGVLAFSAICWIIQIGYWLDWF